MSSFFLALLLAFAVAFRAILGEGEKFKGLVDFCTLNVLVHLRTRRMQAVTCSLQRHWVNTRELRAAKPTALVSRSFWLKAKLDRSKRNGETDCKQSMCTVIMVKFILTITFI